MIWRKEKFANLAIERGHKVIMTPQEYCYLDFYQAYPPNEPMAIGGFLPLELVYAFNPSPDRQRETFVLGGQANVWTEYIPNYDHLEYMVFPRIAAMAEAVWSNPESKDLLGFYNRLEQLKLLYRIKNINYCDKRPCVIR
jgi:hexosaminidase